MRWHLATRNHWRARSLIALALGVALDACNPPAGPASPSGISAVSGNDQYAITGTPTANPMVVLVVDGNGAPFANASVNWSVTAGGGAVVDSVSASDVGGYASMRYTAGNTPGIATVTATVAQFWTATFTVHVEPPASSVR